MKERDIDFQISYHTSTKENTDSKINDRLWKKENTDSSENHEYISASNPALGTLTGLLAMPSLTR